jgi:S-(hydroxymethyl)glutathione dehydrogenase/alcohol dehydrogenase
VAGLTGVRAVVLREYGEPVAVERLRLLPPGPGEVLVRLAASGVCHTDLHVATGDLPLPLPMVLGHEGAGVIEAVGEGVRTLAVGQPVVVSWMPSCGECFWCREGRPDLCEKAAHAAARGVLPGGGTRWLDADGEPVYQFSAAGTMAEAAVVPAACALPVPADVPAASAALLGCSVLTGTGAALRTGRVRPGEHVAIFGAGGVGLQAIQGARIAGALQIIAGDRLPERRAMALRLGATDVVDPEQVDPVLAIVDLTGGRGADCTIEAIGTPETIAAAFNAARRGGRAVVVGVCPPEAEVAINAFALPSQGKTLAGCWYGESDPARDLPELVEHYRAGRLRLDELVTRRFSLEEAQAAFEAMTSGRAARAVLVP